MRGIVNLLIIGYTSRNVVCRPLNYILNNACPFALHRIGAGVFYAEEKCQKKYRSQKEMSLW